MQEGTFDTMIDSGARLMTGHVQIQHHAYESDPRVDNTLLTSELIEIARVQPGVESVSARAQGFALVSQGDRSFGAQIVGIEPEIEREWSGMVSFVSQGRYLQQPGEVLIGATLARNLGLAAGDEMLVLGTAKRGGIAALALHVVGVFDSHQPEFNRAVVFDVTMNSWHGLPMPINCPDGVSRNSLAIYYLQPPDKTAQPTRKKALFAPSPWQKDDKSVLDLIKRRSQVGSASSTYLS